MLQVSRGISTLLVLIYKSQETAEGNLSGSLPYIKVGAYRKTNIYDFFFKRLSCLGVFSDRKPSVLKSVLKLFWSM